MMFERSSMQCGHLGGRLKRSATIWASGRTGDPCFEILGASLLPRGVGFDAFSTLGIRRFWISPNFTHFHPFSHFLGEYQTRCARGACAVRVLGLFRRPFHPEPVTVNGNASEPSRYHLQLLSP